MELEAALTATNDDSNLSNLQLENDEDSGEDEGELVDLLKVVSWVHLYHLGENIVNKNKWKKKIFPNIIK